MEMCYSEPTCFEGGGGYLNFIPGSNIEGQAIGNDVVPNDDIYDYIYLDGDTQKYCIYIQLETGGFMCASNKEVQKETTMPVYPINCCGMDLTR